MRRGRYRDQPPQLVYGFFANAFNMPKLIGAMKRTMLLPVC